MSNFGRFGVELEFFIVDAMQRPIIGSNHEIVELARGAGVAATPELGSFQIELNPGPWLLSQDGIQQGLNELSEAVQILEGFVVDKGYFLLTTGILPRIESTVLVSDIFLTQSPRYVASSSYFASRSARLEFVDGTFLDLPGETAVACLNSVHINLQLPSDDSTLLLFNELNSAGMNLARRFLGRHVVNGKPLAVDCTTMSLLSQANGEYDRWRRVRRVGFLPSSLLSYEEYLGYVGGFDVIPMLTNDEPALDPLGMVYFWVRVRGEPGDIRVEYRPMDMSCDWRSSVEDFLGLVGSEFVPRRFRWE